MAVRPDGAAASRAARVLASVPWIVVLLGVCALVVLLVIALLSFRTRERDGAAAGRASGVPADRAGRRVGHRWADSGRCGAALGVAATVAQ